MSLIIKDLTKVFGRQVAVNAVSFEARPGEILGFLGPNGAGKSTTMKIINAYVPPTSGTVCVCGDDVVENSLEVRRHIGYLPEHNPLYLEMYVHEYLRFIGNLYGLKGNMLKERVGEMIGLCGLALEQHKKIGMLSKGYRQRIGLAQALIHDPQVLILDEPTTGLDPNQLTEIRQLIKSISQQKTVVFSTHIMQEVQALCDRVVIINRGNLVIDSALKDLKQQDKPAKMAHQVIEVEFTMPIDEILLQSVAGIERVERVGTACYQLYISGKQDIREAVFHFVCSRSWSLIGMKVCKTDAQKKHEYGSSLEEIFRSLTHDNNEQTAINK